MSWVPSLKRLVWRVRKLPVLAGLAGGLLLAAPHGARAEIFELASGGRIEGEWLNPTDQKQVTYVVRTAEGVELTLPAEQVRKVQTLDADELEYRRIRAQYPDTVDGQWALAEWCREHRLFDERDAHLERIIELDPDHNDARAALNYVRNRDRWIKHDDLMAEQGYINYKGRWRTRQEIELMESKRSTDLAGKEWMQKVNRWADDFASNGSQEAKQSLTNITDPAAVKALAAGLNSNQSPALKALYIQSLAKIYDLEAIKTLSKAALEDASPDVRAVCLDALKRNPSRDAVGFFVTQLRHKDNRIVNRAGKALEEMADPTTIGPLIDAIATKHKRLIKQGSQNQYNVGFGSGGGGGMTMGGHDEVVTIALNNQAVLNALVTLTGQNFGFDRKAWRGWYAQQKRQGPVEIRRQ